MDEFGKVVSAADLGELFADGLVHAVELPLADAALRRLWAGPFSVATAGSRLLLSSTSDSDFPWELVNRLALTAGTFGNTAMSDVSDERGGWLLPLPSLLENRLCVDEADPKPGNAVILVRKDASPIAGVRTLADMFATADIPVSGVVIVDGDSRRWRRWRRFASHYGVWSDPERPWPTIDVLEAENRRGPRSARVEKA
ncbi:hypothetical protein [Mycolicibacterium sp. P1-18]|uniref:hypothetical protein n=1 Tax=Mycolicibacterium sp. P1-18 TaxID=2024615 RepID=UPI0011F38FAA|nr:hypothetical protein [Mycolicibacterium sp. P1-18]